MWKPGIVLATPLGLAARAEAGLGKDLESGCRYVLPAGIAAAVGPLGDLLKGVFDLNHTEAMFVQFAFFGAYFVGSLAYFLISARSGDPIARMGYMDYSVVTPETTFTMNRPIVGEDGRSATANPQAWDGVYR